MRKAPHLLLVCCFDDALNPDVFDPLSVQTDQDSGHKSDFLRIGCRALKILKKMRIILAFVPMEP